MLTKANTFKPVWNLHNFLPTLYIWLKWKGLDIPFDLVLLRCVATGALQIFESNLKIKVQQEIFHFSFSSILRLSKYTSRSSVHRVTTCLNVICSSSGTDRANGPNLFPIGAVFIPTATPQLSHLGPAEPPITHDLALQVWINTLVSVQGMFALCRPHICSYFTVTSNNYCTLFFRGKKSFQFVYSGLFNICICICLCICILCVFVRTFVYLCTDLCICA